MKIKTKRPEPKTPTVFLFQMNREFYRSAVSKLGF